MVGRKIIRPGERAAGAKNQGILTISLRNVVKNHKKKAHVAGNILIFMLVYMRSVDKHKNSKPQKCCPPAAAGEKNSGYTPCI